jgi:uncharacterized membrane protein (DUF4010 family)
VAVSALAFTIVAYVMATRRPKSDLDGTTETAAALVVVLGVASGLGWLALAAGAGSGVTLALREKERLHSLVRKLGEEELRAALQFAALALVVLPLLPRGPVFGVLAVEPRSLWTIVLIFSGINYVGYLIRQAVGADLGYGIAGALGGLVSSTGVTLTFSRHSRTEPGISAALARGIVAACSVLPLRVLVVTAVVNQTVALALAPLIVPVAVVGGAFVFFTKARTKQHATDPALRPSSPLALGAAIQMTLAFQVAMIALRFADEWWDASGIYASAAVLGLADMDALTFSTSRSALAQTPSLAAAVIATGMVANNMMKGVIAIAIGTGEVRRRAAATLFMLAAIGFGTILVF